MSFSSPRDLDRGFLELLTSRRRNGVALAGCAGHRELFADSPLANCNPGPDGRTDCNA